MRTLFTDGDFEVLIDHNTKDGFEAIAEARDWLLRQGSKELEESESA